MSGVAGAAKRDGSGPTEPYREDAELLDTIRHAQGGDRAICTLLLNKYQPLLGRVTASQLGAIAAGVADEEDLRQEVAATFLELVKEFVPARGASFGAYLKKKLPWRIANYLRSERRRRARTAPLDLAHVVHPTEEMRPNLGLAWENPRLHAALRQLSPRQRMVIAKFYWQERSAREIARELNITPQATTALRRRAEAKIRERLGQMEGEPISRGQARSDR